MAKKQNDIDVKDEMFGRVKLVYGLFIVVALLVLVRLIWVFAISDEIHHNAQKLDERIFRMDTVYARRGSILARDGAPLATSILRYRVDFDMASEGFDSLALFKENADSLAKLLAPFFKDRTAKEYSQALLKEHEKHYKIVYRKDTLAYRSEGILSRFWDMLTGNEFKDVKMYDTLRDHRPVNILPREVDYNEWQVLRKYPILNWNLGMTYRLVTLDQRVYPYGELGRRTLGMVRKNLSEEDLKKNKGRYGVEHVYSEYLEGSNGRTMRQRIAPGFSIAVQDEKNINAEDGLDVVTTLDVDIQNIADAALRRQLQANNAIWGNVMVMEVATGDILAMVNLGETAERSGIYTERDEYALTRRHEPGSTFKLAAMLALLEDCGMSPEKKYFTNHGKPTQVGNSHLAMFEDSHDLGDSLNLKEAVAESSNVYFTTAIYDHYKDNPQRYVEFLSKNLHLDRTVGMEDMGELKSNLDDFKKGGKAHWNVRTLPEMGYGYTIEISPVQTLTLYNAVANRGKMVAPRLIREVRRGDEVVEQFPTKVLVEKICSDKTLDIAHDCLVETARTGTAAWFFRDTASFRVAAKTGTAQYVQGVRRSDGYYYGSMVAYFPAENPKYTVMAGILTCRARGGSYYGAGLTGQVLKEIVYNTYYRDEEWHRELTPSAKEHHPSKVKGGHIASVRKVADKFSPRVSFDKRDGWGVVKVDTLKNVDIRSIEGEQVMPNVKGMGLRDAIYMLESRGLTVRFSGAGVVQSQSIPAGRRIKSGESVTITLR